MTRWMLLFTVLISLHASVAWAHLMPAQQGTLNILGDSVFEVVAVPVSALRAPQFDEDGDGRLSDAEVTGHQEDLQRVISSRFRLAGGVLEFVQVRAEHDERSELSSLGAMHVIALLKTRFVATPSSPTLETDLFGTKSGEDQLTIRARRGSEIEVAVLRPLMPTHRFFRGYLQLLADFIGVGIEHILTGADHLLFLVTVLIGMGAGSANRWRDWLAALTSFTAAHSLTLGLAVFQVATLPSRPVECLIAASIVLSALLNLRRTKTSTRQRVAIVFACGLLHGLGFASAMADMGVVAAQRAVSLLGFNLGIEVGQALFLLLLAGAGRLLAPLARRVTQALPQQLVSPVAAALGALWFFQRLLFAA